MAALVVDATPYAVARSYTTLLDTTRHPARGRGTVRGLGVYPEPDPAVAEGRAEQRSCRPTRRRVATATATAWTVARTLDLNACPAAGALEQAIPLGG